jgi:hypothetical protein
MDELLQKDYIAYLNSLRPLVAQCNAIKISAVRSDVIDDVQFDIKDKESTIKQPLGTGSVTYNNPDNKIIAIIDYEYFLNQQPNNVIKALDLKKCDFIVYHLEGNTFFILNELSLSSSSKNKINDARKQLHNAVFNLSNAPTIKSFINNFTSKLCVFSNKTHLIETPDNIANAFNLIRTYLPQPIKHSYQPITKLGFELVETAIIDA